MFRVLVLFAVLRAGNVYGADLFALYDGPTGVSCGKYNGGGLLAWKRLGGDWKDAAGVLHGEKAFASSGTLKAGTVGDIAIDVSSAIVEGEPVRLFLRLTGTPTFISREGAAQSAPPVPGPRLRVTAESGVRDVDVTADASIYGTAAGCSTKAPVGADKTLGGSAIVIEAPAIAANFARVELVLPIAKIYSQGGGVAVFRTAVPRNPLPAKTTGYAEMYPGDVGIASDPRTYYAETWDRRADGKPPADWYLINKTEPFNTPSRWTRAVNGVPLPNGYDGTFWQPDCGDGRGCFRVQYVGGKYAGYGMPSFGFKANTGGEPDHAFFRYYTKYAPNFKDPDACDGGKRPAWGAPTKWGGNGGTPASGYNGWSVRGDYIVNCDKNNPIYPRLNFVSYVYHALQADFYGDVYPWTDAEDLGWVELDKWVCVEGEMKVNTPGIRDGYFRHWINGYQVQEAQNMYFRGPRPATGYGNLQWGASANSRAAWDAAGYPMFTEPVTGRPIYDLGQYDPAITLGIKLFWGTAFHGGKAPFFSTPDKTTYTDFRDIIVARERIGCRAPAVSVEQLRARLLVLQSRLAAAQADLAALNAQVATRQAEVAALQGEIADVEAQIGGLQ